uniref:Sodium channel and clathrin linker 1 n=1 Tax=Cynoglossus semilaevis TaxID=244447 RepID=A0A3P8VSD7_CYNSE
MDEDVEYLRDQVQRLNSALNQYQRHQQTESTSFQVEGEEHPGHWISDKSIMAPLIREYDRHMDDMKDKLQRYETMMSDIKVKLQRVVKENESLHAELRESVEKQLHALPVAAGMEGSTQEEETVVRNLQEQVQLSEQERAQAMELWHAATQELDRLQHIHQKTISDGQIYNSQRQQLKDQLVQFQQHSHKLQVTNQNLDSTNQQLLKTVTAQSTEMEELHSQLRQAKAELRTATAKVDEMTKFVQNVQDQMQRREEDVADAQGREEASDRRLQQLQVALSQIEARLKASSQEAEAYRREKTVWETKLGEVQARSATLEEEKYEALSKLRESVQMAEEAVLQKDQALLREKQKIEELEKTKAAIKQLIQDAAVRTRKEVYKEGRAEPAEFRKIDALHQRCLNAERLKEDVSLTLQSTQNKLKKMDMDYSEELSRCQEEVRRLQSSLAAARDDCVSISDERLQLQQENLQLRKDMDELRKSTGLVQKKAKQQVSQMEHECSLKEQGLSARMKELEDSSRNSTAQLTRLFAAQQKTTERWKEESKNVVHAFETKIKSLKAELSRQKQRSHELEMQLETNHVTIAEYEKLMSEHQEKSSRLQKRLTQAEQKAVNATQQLTLMTSQRRKAATIDPETL